eukprot:TRINITY_DN806_c0_g1_i1.p1 TRINITY_DN806_c0_g1~~TRINITY_DN806_c0_g1_i1.p1  ORF type:complete len:405 (+),score=58.17 TRINITY_DN806_c0_g1_i1:38-1252(+)
MLSFGVVLAVSCLVFAACYAAKRLNSWWYKPLISEGKPPLPPGDLGWPFIGNMLTFLRAFKSGNPDDFILSFVSRYKRVGVYKAFMFGKPSILVTTPEACKAVLMDDTNFIPGWPKACEELVGRKSFACIAHEEHRRLRKVTAAPISGPEALSQYLGWIEKTIVSSLHWWSKQDRVELLNELRKMTFSIIRYLFLRYETQEEIDALEREYSTLNMGVRAMAINLPGTAYNKALKARRKLVGQLQRVIHQRVANQRENNEEDDMLAQLLKLQDDNGCFLTEEEIIDLLVMYLNAGHESTAHIMMWSLILLQENPEIMQKTKAEQENIVKRRPDGQHHMSFSELREMHYLKKVINEILRIVNISPTVFREAVHDVEVNGKALNFTPLNYYIVKCIPYFLFCGRNVE